MEILKNHVKNISNKTCEEIHGETWRNNNGGKGKAEN